ncbi:MAG: methylmalonyl Co-A mutase-associated GTPase MeaB [Thermodesulfobacteriota bacterium]
MGNVGDRAQLREIIEKTIQKIFAGDRRTAGRLITGLEDREEWCKEVMKRLYPRAGHAMTIGLTGAGGSGKSSLLNHLIQRFRQMGKSLGVIAVDPSSPFSGGAFLGDRIRIQHHTRDDGVFIRSMASRGYLGGLARATTEVLHVMEAMGFETIMVETLGAGQDEIDIIRLVQTCLLVITPSMGDEIQALKAGIMEIGDIFVLNKSDLDGATKAIRSIEAALSLKPFNKGEWRPRIVSTVAASGEGIDDLMEGILAHQDYVHNNDAMERAAFQRVEQEVGLIFRDELERVIFKGLNGSGEKRRYIQSIIDGKSDPYKVVEEIMETFLKKR